MFLLYIPTFGWDLTVCLLLSLGLCTTYLCYRKRTLLFAKMLGTVAVLCCVLLSYATWVEPKRIVVHEQNVQTPLATEITVAVVSDFHVYPGKDRAFLQRAVKKINAQSPDIILLPGDFIFEPNTDFSALEELQGLKAPGGVFAVLGNHDQGAYRKLMGTHYTKTVHLEGLITLLEQGGITVLRNQAAAVNIKGSSVQISGIDDLWSNTHNLPRTAELIDASADIKILVSHNPSIVTDPLVAQYDLVVSGHTHGGQVRLPLVGALAELPTTLGQAVDRGIFIIEDRTTLAITQGIGESGARLRLFAPPEILLLHLQ